MDKLYFLVEKSELIKIPPKQTYYVDLHFVQFNLFLLTFTSYVSVRTSLYLI